MTEDGLTRIEGWARDGLTDEQIAKNIGISERSFTDWKARFPAITSALKKGKAPVDFEVENKLLQRAMGFEYTETVTETLCTAEGERTVTKVYKKYALPDVTAQIFWLKNRKPGIWRDKPEPPVSTEALDRLDEVLSTIKGVV